MAEFLPLLFLPIMLLNFFGGIVGVIWLIFLGQWGLLLASLFVVVISAFSVSFALMPGLLLQAAASASFDANRRVVGCALLIFGNAWSYAVMIFWCVASFSIAASYAQYGQPLLPFLLIAYALATAPFTYMASKEPAGSLGTTIATVVACLGSAALIVLYLAAAASNLFWPIVVFACIAGLGLLLQILAVVAIVNERRRLA